MHTDFIPESDKEDTPPRMCPPTSAELQGGGIEQEESKIQTMLTKPVEQSGGGQMKQSKNLAFIIFRGFESLHNVME